MDALPGVNKKLQYIEEKIDLVDETIQQLKLLSGNANEVCSLCKRFSQQSAQKSDIKREKKKTEGAEKETCEEEKEILGKEH